MNRRICWLLPGLFLAPSLFAAPAASTEEAKIQVFNPRGVLPPIRLIPMAPRLDTLDGKTVYIVHTAFGEPFLPEMQKLLAARYPKTNWIYRRKAGSYFDDDPQLWAEIKAKGNGVIMGVGH